MRSSFAASINTAVAVGMVRSSLQTEEQSFESHSVIAIVADIHNVAAIVLISVVPSWFSTELPNRRRSAVVRIATCKYEHTAVEAASPPVPSSHISVRLRMILAKTAKVALFIGVVQFCIA